MVTSTLPPPKKPEGFKSPLDVANELVTTRRFAIFKDFRGVVYCEQVDQTKVCMSALGKTMGGASNVYRNVVQFEGDHSKFRTLVRELCDRGFTIEPDMAYMLPNSWGVVKVLKVIEDVSIGRKLRKILRDGTPEGYYDGNPDVETNNRNDNKYLRPVQPFTTMIMSRITGEYTTRQALMGMFNEDYLTPEEKAWVAARCSVDA